MIAILCLYRDGVQERLDRFAGGQAEWIPDEKKLNLKLWESDHIFMPWIREGKFFSAKFEYEGNQMRTYHVVFHFAPQPVVAQKDELSDFWCDPSRISLENATLTSL